MLGVTVKCFMEHTDKSLKDHLTFKGWHFHVHRNSYGNLESTNLSRDTPSREIGRASSTVLVSGQAAALIGVAEIHLADAAFEKASSPRSC